MIEGKKVEKVFKTGKGKDDVVAVAGVSFCCEPGRVFALLGPNGSGKTTLLRMISTLMSPDEGELRVAGFDCSKESELVRQKIGFLTGSAGLHEKLSGRETLEFFGNLHGLSKKQSLFLSFSIFLALVWKKTIDEILGLTLNLKSVFNSSLPP